jgi:two-component system response regulator MprA
MLPRKDGFTVIKELREDRLRTHTIIVSAHDSMQDIIYGLDAGADDYLTKLFALDVLLAKVRASDAAFLPRCLRYSNSDI